MILGLTGPNAAGKGEAAAWFVDRGFTYHSLSDIVREEARASGLDTSRESLIVTGQRLRREGGPGILAARMLPRLTPPCLVDSIRSPFEVEVLRGAPGFVLLGVDAPVEVRWQRALARGREGDQPDLAAFIAREERENSDNPEAQQLRRTLALADCVLSNDGSLEQFQSRLEAWLAEQGA